MNKKVEVEKQLLIDICWSCDYAGDSSGGWCKTKECNVPKCPNFGVGLEK